MEIRLIDAQIERDAIIEHFIALDSESYYQRFNSFYNPRFLASYVDSMAPDVCVALCENSQVVGFLHLPLYQQKVEVGISILKDYRSLGLASAMMSFGIAVLKKTHAAYERITVDASNVISANLGRKFGLEVMSI